MTKKRLRPDACLTFAQRTLVDYLAGANVKYIFHDTFARRWYVELYEQNADGLRFPDFNGRVANALVRKGILKRADDLRFQRSERYRLVLAEVA